MRAVSTFKSLVVVGGLTAMLGGCAQMATGAAGELFQGGLSLVAMAAPDVAKDSLDKKGGSGKNTLSQEVPPTALTELWADHESGDPAVTRRLTAADNAAARKPISRAVDQNATVGKWTWQHDRHHGYIAVTKVAGSCRDLEQGFTDGSWSKARTWRYCLNGTSLDAVPGSGKPILQEARR